MYTSQVPSYDIDLLACPADRWTGVIRRDARAARSLAQHAMNDLEATCEEVISRYVPQILTTPARWLIRRPASWLFHAAYKLCGGKYGEEINTWARALGISRSDAALLNCSYELSHLSGLQYGCTAGARWVEGLGMVHVRSMDWPIRSIGNATRLFWFQKGTHRFVSVGILGFVGVISGMVPGRYSVTLNWAPPAGRPTFDFGAAFLLREVLTKCRAYDDAVHFLQHTPLSAPVFYLVCGAHKGQACVIERTHTQSTIRNMVGQVIVQANHHVATKFLRNNHCMHEEDSGYVSALDDSVDRASTLAAGLTGLRKGSDLDDVATVLDRKPVCNDNSYQQMVFAPGSGQVKVWRWRN